MFFITVITGMSSLSDMADNRCFGYYTSLDEALERVQFGHDLEERSYNYLVIENVAEGVYPTSEEIRWFKWNENQNAWQQIDKPKETQHVINWALG